MLELKIDPEFQQKIPPLTEDEYRQLEENILKAGKIYNPIVTWNGFILDGHNRYKIWKEHPEIPEPVTLSVDDKLEDRWAALEWICKNQLGRRNLNEYQKTILIGLAFEARKQTVGNHTDRGKDGRYLLCAGRRKGGITEELLGKELGISAGKVNHAGRFARSVASLEAVSPGISNVILSGDHNASIGAIEVSFSLDDKEKKAFAESLIAGEKLSRPKSKAEKRREKKEVSGKVEDENTSSANPEPVQEPEPDPDAPYLPDYTVKMFREELLANFTSFLETTENLLEWHKNLLVEDPKAKIRIMEVISFEINQLRKVRKDIDEKF